ncbi:fanconi-associated nuclease 1 [Lampris incognitus]|uniref:fanconi-associated nuclease 1 n=1 Tax=Lampris incognitus TaxID=2546036 RepID=UPI0024B58D05|nr:fanconi-associated nuclease 1 [Lampris incognitus]
MSERGNRAKRRRVLSLSKNKNGGNAKRDEGSAATPSIASFFGGAPPPKLACPLCGQLVPRYGINEHIDLQCANFDRGDKAAASAGGSVAPRVPLPPQDSPIKSPDRDPSSAQREDAKTSPYFKKRNSQAVPREMGSGSVVRTVDLGKLSSKLSTRRRRSLDGTQTLDKHVPHRTEEEGCEALGSSQKENNELESLDAKGDRFLVAALTADVLEDGTPRKLADPLRRERGESLECESAKSETINPVLSPKLLSPSFKPKIGGKGEASEDSSSTLRKRARYDERGKEQEEVDISGGLAETVDKNQHSFKETSTALCSTPWNQSLKVHEGSTSAFDSSKQMESGASNAIKDTQNYHPPTLPYYLRNFQSVLKAVLENEDDSMLFNQEDLAYIRTFEKLSVSGRKLYVRLFQRKLKWLQVNKLDYEEICSELGPVAQELVEGGFLQSEQDLQDLREALELLPAPELKGLAKTFHLGGSGTQKQQLVDGLLRLSRQKSLFAVTSGQNSIGAVILKRAKRVAGSCVRLSRVPRAVFSRVLLLFSLTDSVEEEEMAAGGQGQLYTILLVNSGRLAFPDYTVQRCAKLFQDREDLIRYEAAMRTLQEVITAMQAGLWEDALELYTAAKTAWQELRKIYDFRHQEGLPVFLRCFTSGWAYTRIRSRGVEILQRLRRYQDAVEELQSLLAQSVYCPDSRGRWWDRLALNLHQHLKKPEQAICAIRDGLSDPLVRTGHQLSLHQRAVRMKESPSFKKYHLQLRDLPAIHIQDVTHVTIRGQLFPHEGGMGKSVFLMPANEETGESGNATIMCSVEELALAHYRQLGFDQGIHGEGSTFSTLFGLLLWDIIFMEDIPDVFRNPYQTSPLDLFTDCFYENRREAIDTCVQVLGEASTETLHDMLEAVWTSQEGKVCSLVNWKCFSSLQQAQSLVSCLGGTFLGAIITRMAKDYRHCRGGLPDLLVWSTSNNIYKLVEVKGPNDRLSQKQQIWLDELQKLGADVEVCHVTAVGARGTYVE